MNIKRALLILLISLTIVTLVSIVSATDLDDMNFNVSSEFKPIDDVAGLQYEDKSNDIRIRIFDDELDKWKDGYSKYNDTVYVYNETIGGEEIEFEELDETITSTKVIMFNYGEYIKIDGKTYWVEIGSDSVNKEPKYDQILECLEYFNEHNNFESIKTE